ncbi:hypothetical protein MMYC01_206549 [Madurella mycetomatis]|uniref:BTB domain-containing protein n=1 Tax=Madurella mycetomatis TaxID=100816 RepID=A0A175VYQ4_9PEZI|nr:hypothetical protein MMYC01_206549 [Madurella mycetomatis]
MNPDNSPEETPAPHQARGDQLDLQVGVDVSPFASRVVRFQFRSGPPLAIHQAFVLRSPQLALLCGSSTKTIQLCGVSSDVGHALAQYLYTDKLETLNCAGAAHTTNRELARLKTTFEVYSMARTYELQGLEELARAQIELLAAQFDPFTLIDVVKETYPVPIGDDTWFPQYIRSHIKGAFRNPSTLLKAEWPPEFSSGASVVKVLLGCILEVYVDMLESFSGADAVAIDLPTPATDGSFGRITQGATLEAEGLVDMPDGQSPEDTPHPGRPSTPMIDRPFPGEKADDTSVCEPVPDSENWAAQRSPVSKEESVYQLAPEPSAQQLREFFTDLMERRRPEPVTEAAPGIKLTPESTLEPAAEAILEPEANAADMPPAEYPENTLGLHSKKEKKKKKKLKSAASALYSPRFDPALAATPDPRSEYEAKLPEPVWVMESASEPAAEAVAEPEPVPEPEAAKNDDLWGLPIKKRVQKRGKGKPTVEVEPLPEPAPELPYDLEPEPEPEPAPADAVVEPEPVPEPEAVAKNDDFWGWGVTKRDKKGGKGKPTEEVELLRRRPEPEPVASTKQTL